MTLMVWTRSHFEVLRAFWEKIVPATCSHSEASFPKGWLPTMNNKRKPQRRKASGGSAHSPPPKHIWGGIGRRASCWRLHSADRLRETQTNESRASFTVVYPRTFVSIVSAMHQELEWLHFSVISPPVTRRRDPCGFSNLCQCGGFRLLSLLSCLDFTWLLGYRVTQSNESRHTSGRGGIVAPGATTNLGEGGGRTMIRSSSWLTGTTDPAIPESHKSRTLFLAPLCRCGSPLNLPVVLQNTK